MTREVKKAHFEKALTGFGMVTPTSAAPQLYNIWVLKHVAGFSTLTLSASLLMSVMWTLYGLMEGRRPLWAINGLWVALNSATLAGVMAFS